MESYQGKIIPDTVGTPQILIGQINSVMNMMISPSLTLLSVTTIPPIEALRLRTQEGQPLTELLPTQ